MMADQIIPKGYKQTEVGVIPEDWSCTKSGDIINYFAGYSFSSKFSTTNGTPWLKIANVGINRIKWEADSYLPNRFKTSHKDYVLVENDVVMSLTRPIIGNKLKVAKLGEDDVPALLNQRVAKVEAKGSNNQNFTYYLVQRLEFLSQMNLAMAGSDPPNIGTNALNDIFVAIPPTYTEQTAIANALTDMDALISSIEKLIAKKQAIKTATMQQLLTGKKRLPPFDKYTEGPRKGQNKATKQTELGEIPEDWEVVSFGSVLTIKHGRDQKNVECENGSYPILGTGGEMGRTNDYLCNKPSVLIGRKGTIDKPRFMNSPFWTVDTLFYSELKKHVDPKFVFYKFCLVDWRSYSEASGVPSLNSSTIENITQAFPCEKNEQIAIATILSDIDNDLHSSKQRLAKTQQIKQGMMQELLTGRTRLLVD